MAVSKPLPVGQWRILDINCPSCTVDIGDGFPQLWAIGDLIDGDIRIVAIDGNTVMLRSVTTGDAFLKEKEEN